MVTAGLIPYLLGAASRLKRDVIVNVASRDACRFAVVAGLDLHRHVQPFGGGAADGFIGGDGPNALPVRGLARPARRST
jgi:hypothetical protein